MLFVHLDIIKDNKKGNLNYFDILPVFLSDYLHCDKRKLY